MLKNEEYEKYVDLKMKRFSLFTGYVEHRKYPGWSGFLAFYRFDCGKHGSVIDYKHGHNERLDCPICLEETLNALRSSNSREKRA